MNNIINILEEILEICTDKVGFLPGTAKTKEKTTQQVLIRNLYYKYAKAFTKYSLSQIGLIVKRDHATVLHGLKTIENDISQNKEIRYIDSLIQPIVRDLAERASLSKLDSIISTLGSINNLILSLQNDYENLKKELYEIKQCAEAA